LEKIIDFKFAADYTMDIVSRIYALKSGFGKTRRFYVEAP